MTPSFCTAVVVLSFRTMELIGHIGLQLHEFGAEALAVKIYGIWILCVLVTLCFWYNLLRLLLAIFLEVFPYAAELEESFASIFWEVAERVSLMKVDMDIAELPNGVCISNHQSLADFIIFGRLGAQFFTWFHLWRVPSVHMLWNMLRCDENWKLSVIAEHRLLRKMKFPVVAFPEVNIFTEEDLFLQNHHSRSYFGKSYERVLHPRYMAVMNLSNAEAGRQGWFDFTIDYEELLSLIDVFTKPVVVKVRCQKVDIPCREKYLARQLERLWSEKDRRLKEASQ